MLKYKLRQTTTHLSISVYSLMVEINYVDLVLKQVLLSLDQLHFCIIFHTICWKSMINAIEFNIELIYFKTIEE